MGEGQVEVGGGSAERLVLGEARQQPPFVSSFLVSPEVTFGGHGIAVACQVASEDMERWRQKALERGNLQASQGGSSFVQALWLQAWQEREAEHRKKGISWIG